MYSDLISLVSRDDAAVDDSMYGYVPSRPLSIMFIALYGFSFLLHFCQATYFRLWWIYPTICLAGILEILGWGGRLWSSSRPWDPAPYSMQMTCTILGPTPLLAANFIMLGEVIKCLGPEYSRLSPRMYSIVFLTFDIISLIIQAVGGGQAAVAVQTVGGDPEMGGHVMLGGICFQMFTISAYTICAAEFVVRYVKDKPVRAVPSQSERGDLTKGLQVLIGALSFSTLCLWIRSVYRTAELADGWTGRIIETEVYFNVLDGAMITLAMYCINIFHPGFLGISRRKNSSSGDSTNTLREMQTFKGKDI